MKTPQTYAEEMESLSPRIKKSKRITDKMRLDWLEKNRIMGIGLAEIWEYEDLRKSIDFEIKKSGGRR